MSEKSMFFGGACVFGDHTKYVDLGDAVSLFFLASSPRYQRGFVGILQKEVPMSKAAKTTRVCGCIGMARQEKAAKRQAKHFSYLVRNY